MGQAMESAFVRAPSCELIIGTFVYGAQQKEAVYGIVGRSEMTKR